MEQPILIHASPPYLPSKTVGEERIQEAGLDFALSEVRLLRGDYIRTFLNCQQSLSVAKRLGKRLQKCESVSMEKAEEILAALLLEKP
jgi:hypothetical protein